MKEKKKTYELKIQCSNCGNEWQQVIPKGMEWADYQSAFGIHNKAGYGERCWICHEVCDCHNTKFIEVHCEKCDSSVLQKRLGVKGEGKD